MKKLRLYYGFYDFANSAYGVVLQNYLLPVYFSTVLINYGFTLGSWGLANGLSTILGVSLGIIFGKIIDKKGNRINSFLLSIIITFLFSIILGLAIHFNPKLVFYTYILANGSYILTLSIYNSLLTHLADEKISHEFSGFAWGFGYIGSTIGLILTMVLQKIVGNYSPIIFIFISLFFLVFSLISINGIKKAEFIKKQELKEITNKSKYSLLFGYWLISECITVILLFFSVYITGELKLSVTMAGACILLVQIIGFPSTVYGSRLFSKIGETRSMNIMVFIWFVAILSLISGLGYFSLILTLVLGGLVVGNSQSLMRSEYSNLINPEKSGVEFGIFGFITQIGSFIGPIIYGFLSDILGNQKIPLLIFGIFMVIGVIIINYSKIYDNKNVAKIEA